MSKGTRMMRDASMKAGTRSRDPGNEIPVKNQHGIRAMGLGQEETMARLNRKIKAIRMKKIHSLNRRFERMVLNKRKQEEFAKKMKKSRCYNCKKRGHAYWNCPTPKTVSSYGKMVVTENPIEETNHYVQKYEDKVPVTGDFLVRGTEYGGWNETWFVGNTYTKHMTPHRGLFLRFKNCFDVEKDEHNRKFLFSHGIGETDLKTNERTYVIPVVAYVPEIGINLLSMHQLICQGFEIEVEGSKCKVRHMFDAKHDDVSRKEVLEKQDDFLNSFFLQT